MINFVNYHEDRFFLGSLDRCGLKLVYIIQDCLKIAIELKGGICVNEIDLVGRGFIVGPDV